MFSHQFEETLTSSDNLGRSGPMGDIRALYVMFSINSGES